MKSVLLLIILVSCFAEAQSSGYFEGLFGNPSSSTTITETSYNQGDTRPKSILKNVFYIGGSDRRRSLMSSGFLNNMCEAGFSRVYSVYKKVDRRVSCGGNSYDYSYIGEAKTDGGGRRVERLFSYLYSEVINGSEGAVFLHCHYGVHASNTIGQMALMQFCGVSRDQAKRNWDVIDLYDSLGAKGRARQFRKIDDFTPFAEFSITASQRAQICH